MKTIKKWVTAHGKERNLQNHGKGELVNLKKQVISNNPRNQFPLICISESYSTLKAGYNIYMINMDISFPLICITAEKKSLVPHQVLNEGALFSWKI